MEKTDSPLEQDPQRSGTSLPTQFKKDGFQPTVRPTATLTLFEGQSALRSLVRLCIFLAIVIGLGAGLITELAVRIFGPFRIADSPHILLILEAGNFLLVLGATACMALLEHRPMAAYGLSVRTMFSKNFWLGALFGLIEVTILVGLIAAFGGYSFGSLELRSAEALGWGFFYLILFLFVGLYEEYLFRGYAQFTLGQGIGFWPAAVVLSVGFGYVHLGNKGENWVGAAGVVLVALLFAFTLRRTGNLWYAIGLHASFDWGESFLYSVPNSGEIFRGHLSGATLSGPHWLTGGSAGPEGSVFCFVTMGLQFLAVALLFPVKKEQPAESSGISS